jgi:hypothetical protein
MTKIYACSRPNACCPSIELLADGKTIEIEDDDGDTVDMTKKQWEDLRKIETKDL